VKQGRRQAGFVPADLPVSDYAAKWTTAEAFVVRTVDAVLRNLGAPPMQEGEASPEAIIAATGIAPGYAGLVGRWLRRLRETTALSDAEKQALAGARGNREALTAASAAFDRAFADNPQLHAYIRHCAGLVADVLTGKVSPLETLFPGGDFVMAEELYAHSATMRYVNALAAETVRAFAGHGSGGSALRILEVGAGTGGTTGAILQSLRADAVEYYFTDTSDAFLARARSRFAHYPFLRFGRLDVEGDFAQAGFPEGSVNAIVGANVVHATKDVRACLRSLRTALAPGGMLVLVESTTDFAWFDITTWLIEGWRAFDDGIRNASPLLTAGAWSSVLHESGFDAVECLPGEGSPAAVLGQHVIIARAPGHGVARPVSMPSMADAETPRAPESLSPTSEFLASLRRVFPADRQELMVGFVRERVMKTLGLDEAHRPDRHGRLMSMGVDSLMAVQLRNLLGRDLGLGKSVTATLIYDYPSIEDIARHLLSLLDLGREKEPVPPAPSGPSQGEAEMATLSDEEVEQMLRNKLDGKQRTD
jgi:SAM-dependent methyltransferase